MLHIFDMDGTLIEDYVKKHPYERVEILPRRKELLAGLISQGNKIAIATNQGGIAFGYNTEEEARTKIRLAIEKLGLDPDTNVAVCFSDARSKDDRYNKPEDYARRKPSGRMLRELMVIHGTNADQTIYVGDRPEDQQAALDAGVPFVWAETFFAADAEETASPHDQPRI